MAKIPSSEVVFESCGDDCGYRQIVGLPKPLPEVAADFDWQSRDYDGFRLLMLEELAARVPERRRWNPADLEVVIIEALAAALDQMSDAADRIFAEAYLETARRPESLRRLLSLIGYNAVKQAQTSRLLPSQWNEGDPSFEQQLDRLWELRPALMEQARTAGPRELLAQRRMVTADDYRALLDSHPLVIQSGAVEEWGGAWSVVRIAVELADVKVGPQTVTLNLGSPLNEDTLEKLKADDKAFCDGQVLVPWNPYDEPPEKRTVRALLSHYIDQLRMVGQDYRLIDVKPVGLWLGFEVVVDDTYLKSEVQSALEQRLGLGPGGFFEEGRLRCGQDIRLGDLIQQMTAEGGVKSVTVTRFLRQDLIPQGTPSEEAAKLAHKQTQMALQAACIEIQSDELAICDPNRPRGGTLELTVS